MSTSWCKHLLSYPLDSSNHTTHSLCKPSLVDSVVIELKNRLQRQSYTKQIVTKIVDRFSETCNTHDCTHPKLMADYLVNMNCRSIVEQVVHDDANVHDISNTMKTVINEIYCKSEISVGAIRTLYHTMFGYKSISLMNIYDKYSRYCATQRDTLRRRMTIASWLIQNRKEVHQYIEALHANGIYTNTIEIIASALERYHRRLLPTFQRDESFIIYDDLNVFAEYVYSMNEMVHCLAQYHEVVPTQLDLWIIPRFVTKHKEEDDGAQIWDIEPILKTAGYTMGTDYFVEYIPDGVFGRNQFFSFVGRYITGNPRNQRYIVIVDRRNPHHIDNREMEDDTESTWNNKMYIICTRNKIPNDCNIFNECYAINTKEDLLPLMNFGGLDAAKGYKFLLSYHIYSHEKVKQYWYFGHGVMPFRIKDMDRLWPRYFKRLDDGQYQTLDLYFIKKIYFYLYSICNDENIEHQEEEKADILITKGHIDIECENNKDVSDCSSSEVLITFLKQKRLDKAETDEYVNVMNDMVSDIGQAWDTLRIQIDCWIMPQMIRKSNGDNYNMDNAQVWNVEDTLKDFGYRMDRDYFATVIPHLDQCDSYYQSLYRFVRRFIMNDIGYERYIVVIDRNEKGDIDNKSLDDTQNDKLYVIPQEYNTLDTKLFQSGVPAHLGRLLSYRVYSEDKIKLHIYPFVDHASFQFNHKHIAIVSPQRNKNDDFKEFTEEYNDDASQFLMSLLDETKQGIVINHRKRRYRSMDNAIIENAEKRQIPSYIEHDNDQRIYTMNSLICEYYNDVRVGYNLGDKFLDFMKEKGENKNFKAFSLEYDGDPAQCVMTHFDDKFPIIDQRFAIRNIEDRYRFIYYFMKYCANHERIPSPQYMLETYGERDREEEKDHIVTTKDPMDHKCVNVHVCDKQHNDGTVSVESTESSFPTISCTDETTDTESDETCLLYTEALNSDMIDKASASLRIMANSLGLRQRNVSNENVPDLTLGIIIKASESLTKINAALQSLEQRQSLFSQNPNHNILTLPQRGVQTENVDKSFGDDGDSDESDKQDDNDKEDNADDNNSDKTYDEDADDAGNNDDDGDNDNDRDDDDNDFKMLYQREIIRRIDLLLNMYYQRHGVNGYFHGEIGKLSKFMNDRELFHRNVSFSDQICDTFDPEKHLFVQFDVSFPFPQCVHSNHDKGHIIFEIIKHCFGHHTPPSDNDVQYIVSQIPQPDMEREEEKYEFDYFDDGIKYNPKNDTVNDMKISNPSKFFLKKAIRCDVAEQFVDTKNYMKQRRLIYGKNIMAICNCDTGLCLIINYNFHCKKSKAALYIVCDIKKDEWKMRDDKLYTAKALALDTQYSISQHQLPQAEKMELKLIEEIKEKMSKFKNKLKTEWFRKLEDPRSRVKWDQVHVHERQSSSPLSLELNKSQFNQGLKDYATSDNMKQFHLLPIITVREEKYEIEIIWIIDKYDSTIGSFGISLGIYENKIVPRSIYLNIGDEHKMVPDACYNEEMAGFKCNIHALSIGVHVVKHTKEKLHRDIKVLELQIQELQQRRQEDIKQLNVVKNEINKGHMQLLIEASRKTCATWQRINETQNIIEKTIVQRQNAMDKFYPGDIHAYNHALNGMCSKCKDILNIFESKQVDIV